MSVKAPNQVYSVPASVTGANASAEPTLNGVLYDMKVRGTTGTVTLTIVSGVITVVAQT